MHSQQIPLRGQGSYVQVQLCRFALWSHSIIYL